MQMGYRILQELPELLQSTDYKVTTTLGLRGGVTEIMQVEPGDRSGSNFYNDFSFL